jgi:hypothetical protein
MSPRAFSLTYDYLCPFAKNMHLHVLAALRAGGDYDVTFEPWTLHQSHRAEGAPDVWDDPAKDGDLLALAASVSVRDQQPEFFLAVHEALFRARHHDHASLKTPDEVNAVLAPIGVDVALVTADLATRRPFDVLGAAYQQFAPLECFGVPTFVSNGRAVFVRYMTEPETGSEDKDSRGVVDQILDLMDERPLLNEYKFTQVPK